MLRGIVHWIYCLPLWHAVVLALAATGLFFWLRRRYGNQRWWKPAILLLLVCWAVVVVINNVAGRGNEIHQVSLIPFQTYITVFSGGQPELIRSAFMNVLLFYPGGLLALSLLPCRKRAWLLWLFVAMSLGVEICQYAFHVGVAETDDVLHNTLGAALGLLSLRQYDKHNTGVH